MDLLASRVANRSWQRVVKVATYSSENPFRHSTGFFLAEYSGVSHDPILKVDSKRQDLVFFVPMILLENVPSRFTKDGFFRYESGKLPFSLALNERVRVEISENGTGVLLRFPTEEVKDIVIPSDDPVAKTFMKSQTLSVGFQTKGEFYFARVAIGLSQVPPCTPTFKGTLLGMSGEKEKAIRKAIQYVDRYPMDMPSRIDAYLDAPEGVSNYDVFQSTSSENSLPRVTNLGGICWGCAVPETTREHCSPKWMADKYGVEPLVAPILCKSCNSFFGEKLEAPAAEILKNPINRITKETRSIIVVWCIKTAITMSMASGVNVDPKWLLFLRQGVLPDGFRVYFDPRQNLNEQGFNYGVSRFSDQLLQSGAFLFTFSTPSFTMCVVRETHNPVEVPLLEIYPHRFVEPQKRIAEPLADMHQRIHERISGQPTVPNDLPRRKQSPRS